ncbi:hypothetical protein DV737_g4913, partial [Chaetothyriales sp. CBS 132003]
MGSVRRISPSQESPDFPLPPWLFARKDSQGRRLPQTISHRGYRAQHPENTMAAFKGAVEAGTHAIETDIHLSKDNVVVLSHDADLKRCFGQKEKIIDSDWSYLSTLRTLKVPHEPLPRLSDLLTYLSKPELSDIWILLDIKIDNDADTVMRLIAQVINSVPPSPARPWSDRILLGIWIPKFLPLCVKYSPGFPTVHIGASTSYARQFFSVPNVSFNMLQKALVGPLGACFIRDVKKDGRLIYDWTVNDVNSMKWSIQRELDGVITDNPKLFNEVCKNWKFEAEKRRIMQELGPVRYYVNARTKAHLVVPDDDVSGTFVFVRALEEHGTQATLSAEEIGQTWLNNTVERKSIFWWGGRGISTEHTAYLNLKRGIKAPLSGSIHTNGKTVAEQIGAQIFIDGWAIVAPGNPSLAVKLAEAAGSVSHDGVALHAAKLWAAMEAEAFISKDVDHLLDVGLTFIPAHSLITKLVSDIRKWAQIDHDWEKTRQRIEDVYGYDKFLGVCHVVPNHGIMISALIYGGHNFHQAMHIINTSGWDTDCNSGNIGCLVAIMHGLAAFDDGPDWRGPLADRALISSADIGYSLNNATRITYDLVNLGRRLAGAAALPPPKDGAQFHFSLPGSVQGFIASRNSLLPDLVQVQQAVDDRDRPSLAIRLNGLTNSVEPVEVLTQTFTPPEIKEMRETYGFMAAPLVYPGQKVTALLRADKSNNVPVSVNLRLKHYNITDTLSTLDGPSVTLVPDQETCTYVANQSHPGSKHLTVVFDQHESSPLTEDTRSDCPAAELPSATEVPQKAFSVIEEAQEMDLRLTQAATIPPDACGIRTYPSRKPIKGIFSKIIDICQRAESDPTSDFHHLLQKCKSASRAIKARDKILSQVNPHLSDYLPVREVADKLIQSYLKTFEGIFRVLQVPSFFVEYEAYWLNPQVARQTLVVKLLLIMAIGTLFQPQNEVDALRPSALQWIHIAQTWLSTPYEKHRLTVEGLQIQCLLLLARLVYDVDGDLLWLSAGNLVRSAMHIGLHIDPESYTFEKLRPQHIQQRRMLWATVLEIVVQTSMDAGGLPMISIDDYNCKVPLNADDLQQKEGIADIPSNVKADDHFTQASLQIMLMRSLPLRLEAAAFINNFRPESGSYDKAMCLSNKLLEECRTNSALLQTFTTKSLSRPTDFQVNLIELMTYQFLFALHLPYALEAKSNRAFYYSKKLCLDLALRLASNSSPNPDDGCRRLGIWGGGLFRAIPVKTTGFIAEELIDQIQTDAAFFSTNATILDRRNGLYKHVKDFVDFLLVRIQHGQPNVRGHVLYSAILAQINAMLDVQPVEESIVVAIEKSLTACYEVLRGQLGVSALQLSPVEPEAQEAQLEPGRIFLRTMIGRIQTSTSYMSNCKKYMREHATLPVKAKIVYQTYYEEHQLKRTSPSTIAWIGSLQAFFQFAGSLFGGPLFDMHGAMVMRTPAVFFVLSIMMTSICTELWHFILAQGVLGGISLGMTFAPAVASVGHYFRAKRGAAMGIGIAGSSLGGVIFPIALNQMLHKHKLGFGWSVRIIGFMVLALLAPACLSIKARLRPRKASLFLPRAFKEVPYDLLVGASFLLLLGMFPPMFFIPSYAVAQGMDHQLAFYLVAILNSASFPGRIIPGLLADKFGRLNMLCFAGISTGILSLCWQACHSNASIIVYTALFGFCSGAIISGQVVAIMTVPRDPRNIGTYMGMAMGVASLACLVGPPGAGAMASHYDSYTQISIFSGVVSLAGGLLVIPAKLAAGHGLLSLT